MRDVDYYKKLFDNAFEPILLIEGHFFIDGNQAALEILNMQSKDELKVVHPSQLSPKYQPDGRLSLEKANEMINVCYEKGYHQFEWLHKTLDEKEFLVEVTLKTIIIDGKTLMHTTWRELGKEKDYQKNLEKQNQLLEEKNILINEVKNILHTNNEKNLFDKLTIYEEYKRVLDESSIVSKADIDGNITFVNDKFCEISGYTRGELIGQNHSIIRHPDTPKEVFKNMWDTITSKKVFKGVVKNQTKDKKTYYVDSTVMPILDKDDNIIEYISVRHDITKIYEQDKIINKQYTDELTNLPNRIKLISDIENSINPKLAILNLDSFKDINESYSLEVGDLLLQQVANRLKKLESINIKAYRIAGDVFALFAHGNTTFNSLHEICKIFILDLDDNSFEIDDINLEISVTIGLAFGKDKLLTHTEIAHLYAKKNHKELAIFDEELPIYKELVRNIQVTKDIKNAIKNNNILLFGQKIVNNYTKEEKYETLMRLKLENGDILSPFFFLEQAKKAKLYPELSRRIIKLACEYFSNKNISFSINLMIEDIKNDKTVEFLFEKLKETNTAKNVILEIVESEAIETYKEVEVFINDAKKLGCKIAIDDFGTGYSNFEYLIRLNIDILKIDGSLIKNIHIDKNTHLTVKTIVNFAKVLKFDVVAEFVHCQEVQNIIKELGIEYSQGYLLHKPQELQ